MELYKNLDFNINTDFNFNNSIISLITYSKNEKKEARKVVVFLKQLQDILNEAKINEIYVFLLSEKGSVLNEAIIKCIIEFYTKDKEINTEIFLEIMKKCNEKIKGQFLDNINSAIPNEKDFLEIERSQKYDLFKGLLDLEIFKNEKFKSIYYIERIKAITLDIQKKLISGEMKWIEISPFYEPNANEEEKKRKEIALSDKLLSIFLKDENKANKIKSDLDEYNITIKNKLNSLNIILEDFLGFFNKSQESNIKDLKELIKDLSSGPINSYDKKKEKIENLINQYEEEARKRNNENKSCFFYHIYERKKNKFKNNDEKDLIARTEKDFKTLKIIFRDGIQALNKDLLKECLEAIKEKKEITDEIDILMKLFEIEISQERKAKLINSLVVLSKKENVIEIAKAISIFINKVDLPKNKLWNLANEIIDKSEKLNEETVLNKYINDLKTYDIDIDLLSEPGYYLNILLILKKNPDSISFLIGKKEEDCRNLQEAAADDDSGFLDVNNIKDFEECVKFFNKFGDTKNFKQQDSVKFFQSFKKEVEKDNNIVLYFTKYVNDYGELKNLYDSNFDKTAASKRIIFAICEEAKFILKNEVGHFFKGFYKIEKENKMKKIKMSGLKELRDRAQLTKKMNNVEEIENQKKIQRV